MLGTDKRRAIDVAHLIETPRKLSVVHEFRVPNDVVKNNGELVNFAGLVAAIQLVLLRAKYHFE